MVEHILLLSVLILLVMVVINTAMIFQIRRIAERPVEIQKPSEIKVKSIGKAFSIRTLRAPKINDDAAARAREDKK